MYFWRTHKEAGVPKLRWLDCIDIDVKSTGVKRWRKKAEAIYLWAVILKEVKVQGP